MRLASYLDGRHGAPRLGIVMGDAVLDACAAATHLHRTGDPSIDEAAVALLADAPIATGWLTPGGLRALARISLASVALPAELRIPLSGVRLAPPVPRPGKIIATGFNYHDHVKEGARVLDGKDGKPFETLGFPTGFLKLPSTLIGTGEPIVKPEPDEWLDYEIELAVVVGRRAERVPIDGALSYVAGYTVFNDVSARRIQLAEMEQKVAIVLGKNYPTFGPIGPWLVTADEIPDPQTLDITLSVNGDVRQHANTSDMIHTVATLIAYWSRLGLDAGDIITTGTPAGVAVARSDPGPYYLKDGDVVEASIERIGSLRNPVREPR